MKAGQLQSVVYEKKQMENFFSNIFRSGNLYRLYNYTKTVSIIFIILSEASRVYFLSINKWVNAPRHETLLHIYWVYDVTLSSIYNAYIIIWSIIFILYY